LAEQLWKPEKTLISYWFGCWAITGKQIDPDEFKAVRTVDDVINAVASIVGVE